MIRNVTIYGSEADEVLSLAGTGFSNPGLQVSLPYLGDLPNFRIFDLAQVGHGEWGYTGDANALAYLSWIDTQIVVNGFNRSPGDAIILAVWNDSGQGATWGGNVPFTLRGHTEHHGSAILRRGTEPAHNGARVGVWERAGRDAVHRDRGSANRRVAVDLGCFLNLRTSGNGRVVDTAIRGAITTPARWSGRQAMADSSEALAGAAYAWAVGQQLRHGTPGARLSETPGAVA